MPKTFLPEKSRGEREPILASAVHHGVDQPRSIALALACLYFGACHAPNAADAKAPAEPTSRVATENAARISAPPHDLDIAIELGAKPPALEITMRYRVLRQAVLTLPNPKGKAPRVEVNDASGRVVPSLHLPWQ